MKMFRNVVVVILLLTASADASKTTVQSPDGRNSIVLQSTDEDRDVVRVSVSRDRQQVLAPSPLGPVLTMGGALNEGSRIVTVRHGKSDDSFQLFWGKTSTVADRFSYAVVTLATPTDLRWEVELRAYDDGVAFRYRLLRQDGQREFAIREEVTQFNAVGEPTAFFNTLDGFTTSHESLYARKSLSAIPVAKLLDMPLLLVWPSGQAAAITEARVRHFAGMYLERRSNDSTALRCRLSPRPSDKDTCVVGTTPHESPWRVVLLADHAGKLLESNLLLCLNDPPQDDFRWARPGKTSFHWWYGEFEDDYKLSSERDVYFRRHRKYIDFCAENRIAYHAVSGDGLAWYVQSPTDYGTPAADADVLRARLELGLPQIIAYARDRGVGIRLWVHWKPLSEKLEEAFARYESWGVKGIMVDFLDRDDQEMVDFTERMLKSAARHKLHVQIHGSSKFSGEQRTFPNLFNREGVLNLEYVKWSDLCTPAHNVNVAYTPRTRRTCRFPPRRLSLRFPGCVSAEQSGAGGDGDAVSQPGALCRVREPDADGRRRAQRVRGPNRVRVDHPSPDHLGRNPLRGRRTRRVCGTCAAQEQGVVRRWNHKLDSPEDRGPLGVLAVGRIPCHALRRRING